MVPDKNLHRNATSKEPSQYELCTKMQAQTERRILQTWQISCLEEDLRLQAIEMMSLQQLLYNRLARPRLQNELFLQRDALDRKERQIKAVTAELNMTQTNVERSESSLQGKSKKVLALRGKLQTFHCSLKR